VARSIDRPRSKAERTYDPASGFAGPPPSSLLRTSKAAYSSPGESTGCVSDVPFTCVISTTGSQRARVRAYSALIGRPSLSTRSNIRPLERFELCGSATNSAPVSALVLSSQRQRSSGRSLSK
jgi:hypothetical protein